MGPDDSVDPKEKDNVAHYSFWRNVSSISSGADVGRRWLFGNGRRRRRHIPQATAYSVVVKGANAGHFFFYANDGLKISWWAQASR